jgi:hypothetical protein
MKGRRMTVGTRARAGASMTAIVWLLALVSIAGQAGPPPGPQMSESVFKNILILKGIPVDEFMDTMGMFAAIAARLRSPRRRYSGRAR